MRLCSAIPRCMSATVGHMAIHEIIRTDEANVAGVQRMVCCMNAPQATPNRGIRATDRIRLRADIFDARTLQLNATTEVDRAQLCGVDRTTLYRIRHGKTTPSLELAMDMASRLGVTVEQLFEQVTDE